VRKRGLTAVEVVLLVAVLIVLVVFLLPFSRRTRETGPNHNRCPSNLRQLHTSMTLYSQDYDGVFPMVPLGKGHVVGEDVSVDNLKPGDQEDAGKDFPPDHNPSVSQNLWLLVRGDFAQPEIFTCPSSEQAGNKCNTRDFNGSLGGVGADYFADFPWRETGAVMSYSFVQPWSEFSKEHSSRNMWKADIDPRFVLGADANNGSQPDYQKNRIPPRYSDLKEFVNGRNHVGDGQNVLYGDGHTTFAKTAYCGIGGDNIFTARPAGYMGKPDQTAGVLNVRPQDPFDPKTKQPAEWDTVLVPNQEVNLAKWNRKP